MTTRQAGGIALVLVVISVLLSTVLQTVELVHSRTSLAEMRELQEGPVQEALRMQRQFDALAAGVGQLAASGDTGAKTVIEEMRRQGVTLPEPKH